MNLNTGSKYVLELRKEFVPTNIKFSFNLLHKFVYNSFLSFELIPTKLMTLFLLFKINFSIFSMDYASRNKKFK